MNKNIKKIIAAASVATVICASGCSNEAAPETTTVPVETTSKAIVTETAETESAVTQTATKAEIDYSKEDRVVEIPYDGGYTAIFAFNANNDVLRRENIPWGEGNTYYTYDNEGKLIKTVNRSDDDFEEKRLFTYDENGNAVKVDIYEDEELVEYYTYKYDENGNKIYESLHYGGNGEIKYETTFEYDADGKLITDKEEIVGGEYDADGNLIKETVDGVNVEHVYENGLLTKTLHDGEIKIEYAYFDNNNIVRIYCYETEDSIGEINICLYSEAFEN